MATKYFTCAETAKMVRTALKEAFPDIKFSVRSSVYRGGASIRVGYIDGPNANQVEAVAKVFEGAYFDGMQDYKGSCYSMVDGVSVKFGADFIFVEREYSQALINKACAAVQRRYPGNVKALGIETLDFQTLGDNSRKMFFDVGNDDLGQVVYRVCRKITDRMKVYSATAAKVIYMGNDGYSDVGALNPKIAEAV